MIGQAETHFSLGMLESAKKEWPQAQESFARAAKLYEDSGAFLGESNARFQNASALAAQGHLQEARQELQNAIDLGEVVRILAPGPELKTSYFASVEQMYRAEIDLILKDADSAPGHPEAFEIFQRAQSRTLLAALGSKVQAAQTKSSKPVMDDIEEQKKRLASLVRLPTGTDEKKKIISTIKEIKALLKQLEAESLAQYQHLNLFFNAVSANDIKQRIIDQTVP